MASNGSPSCAVRNEFRASRGQELPYEESIGAEDLAPVWWHYVIRIDWILLEALLGTLVSQSRSQTGCPFLLFMLSM